MRRALLIGIDHYPNAPLAGCVNDAKAMAHILQRNYDGSVNFSPPKIITSDTDRITRATLLTSIEYLFRDEAEVALLYFAGHGTEIQLDGFLVTPDAKKYSEGVGLTEVLALANASKASEKVIILDSCYGGAFGQIPATGNDLAHIREGVSVLTASRSTQTAAETNGRGVFTELVCSALEGGAADVLGKVTVPSVYAYVDEALGPWGQRPLFKSHVSKLVALRQAQPAVALETLRRLPMWFLTPDSELPLDPSYEPTESPAHAEHEVVFAQLQKCRAVKIVEPVGEDHMYYAAMHSKACRLTALGQRYWRQAKEGHI